MSIRFVQSFLRTQTCKHTNRKKKKTPADKQTIKHKRQLKHNFTFAADGKKKPMYGKFITKITYSNYAPILIFSCVRMLMRLILKSRHR